MRLLFVSPLFPTERDPFKSPDIHVLARNLIKRGHYVHVITVKNFGLSVLEETFKGINVYEIPAFNFAKVGYPIPNLLTLIRLIRKIGGDFDIHHYFYQEFLTIIPSFFFRSIHRVLTVDNFPGVDWSYGRSVIDAFGRLQSKTIGRKSLKQFDGIIFWSKRSMETAACLEPEVAGKTVFIPDGVDAKHIKPDPELGEKVRTELGVKGVVVAFVGRLVPVKGIIFLAEAIGRLDREGFTAHYVIVGDGPERTKLETLRLSNSKVHMVGFKKNPIPYMQAADMLVLPSLGEGCPNVVLEAFACGKPVVASSVGGTPSLVQNSVNGKLVPAKDALELADAIRVLASDAKKLKVMGLRAREFAEKELDWDVVTNRIQDFYLKILNK